MQGNSSSNLDANKLHERAREAASEYHKLLTQLSTGLLAIYFLALTSSIEPPLTLIQRSAALSSLILMGLAVLFGVMYWLADALRNYYWGSSIAASTEESNHEQERLYGQKILWQRVIRIGTWGISISFLCGIATSTWYMILRLFSL